MLGLVTYFLILTSMIIAVWWRPTVGVAAVLCLYGLKQWGQSTTEFFSDHREFSNFAVFLIALVGLLRASQKRSCLFCEIPATTKLVLLIFLYAFISLAWTPDLDAAIDQWLAQGPYILTIALLAPLLFSSFRDARTAFTWTALVGAAICVLALAFGKWGGRGLILYGREVSQEYETNPLAMASMAGTVAIIAAMSFSRPNGIAMRVLATVIIPISIAVILRSGARGQLIATAAGVAVALPIAFRVRDIRSIAALLLAGVIVVGLGYVASSYITLDADRWGSKQSTEDISGRLANAAALLQASSSHFFSIIFGLGNSSAFKVVGFYPHITGLEVIAEEGIVGAAIYFAILFVAGRSIVRINKQEDPTGYKRNALAILSGLFVFELVLSWKQGSLLGSVYVFGYAIALARLERPIGSLNRLATPAQAGVVRSLPRFENLLR